MKLRISNRESIDVFVQRCAFGYVLTSIRGEIKGSNSLVVVRICLIRDGQVINDVPFKFV
jgi:hypothetical protein